MEANNQTEKKERTVNLANLTVDDCFNLIFNALNKANSQGVFELDEAYVLKIAHNNLKMKFKELITEDSNEVE